MQRQELEFKSGGVRSLPLSGAQQMDDGGVGFSGHKTVVVSGSANEVVVDTKDNMTAMTSQVTRIITNVRAAQYVKTPQAVGDKDALCHEYAPAGANPRCNLSCRLPGQRGAALHC